jgi:hypothetical protein
MQLLDEPFDVTFIGYIRFKIRYHRFPGDFLIKLTKKEWKELITICDKLPETVKYSPVPPIAFNEQGVSVLSNILTVRRPTL